ncbi:class I SAM-dependent methyltransferase [Pendulispora brunnea]|uniref:Class I SAM-dependent methyltransferase n=1 Tax=Pendulispora brunnea TaxID=2905690 RepID=A0ABZ2JV48_9BACT
MLSKSARFEMKGPPTTSEDFDRAYRKPVTFWGDIRTPPEIKAMARGQGSALELGCGVGRFSRYLARQGLRVTAVDFSPVAIGKARASAIQEGLQVHFLVGNVTQLDALDGPFNMSFDVGCFHCLDASAQRGYVSEVFRLLEPGGIHLIWVLDEPPSGIALSPRVLETTFGSGFALQDARPSRRRLVRSHWYWLQRRA